MDILNQGVEKQMSRRPIVALVAILSIAATALSGCNSDSKSDGSSGDDKGAIKILTMYTDTPALSNKEIASNVEAAAKEINDAGGINGRKLEVISCNNQLDPNVHLTCIHKAIDEKVSAVVGSVSFFPTVYPALEKAGIPFLGGFGIQKEELNSPISFPVSAGEPGWYYGQAKQLADLGMKNPAWIQCEPAACKFGEEIFRAAWKQYTGGELGKVITIPDKATDLSTYAADLISSGVDSIATGMYVTENQQLTKELRTGGWDGPIAVNGPNMTTDVLKELGPNLGDFYVSGGMLPPSAQDIAEVPEMAEWNKAIEAYAPGLPASELALNGWASTKIFIDVAKTLKDVNASTMMDALNAITPDNPVVTGIAPPFSAVQGDPPLAEFSRLSNLEVSIAKADPSGALIQDQAGSFLNLAS
jgi:ABC-type branched-subunit amino acid transport system substrate-binding protein